MLSTATKAKDSSPKSEEKKADEKPKETAKPAEEPAEKAVALEDITLTEMTVEDLDKTLT
jgi:hypothetical protein